MTIFRCDMLVLLAPIVLTMLLTKEVSYTSLYALPRSASNILRMLTIPVIIYSIRYLFGDLYYQELRFADYV